MKILFDEDHNTKLYSFRVLTSVPKLVGTKRDYFSNVYVIFLIDDFVVTYNHKHGIYKEIKVFTDEDGSNIILKIENALLEGRKPCRGKDRLAYYFYKHKESIYSYTNIDMSILNSSHLEFSNIDNIFRIMEEMNCILGLSSPDAKQLPDNSGFLVFRVFGKITHFDYSRPNGGTISVDYKCAKKS